MVIKSQIRKRQIYFYGTISAAKVTLFIKVSKKILWSQINLEDTPSPIIDDHKEVNEVGQITHQNHFLRKHISLQFPY